MPPRQRILLIANTGWYLYNFRNDLIDQLVSRGLEVHLAAPHDDCTKLLVGPHRKSHLLQLENRCISPFSNLRVISRLLQLHQEIQPSLTHCFTIKPVILGGIAARLHGTPHVNHITGLGHLFTDNRPLNLFLRPFVRLLYAISCKGRMTKTIFENDEDRRLFIKWNLVDHNTAYVIRGAGVNCERFRPSPRTATLKSPRILYAGRLIREKGIIELCSACQILRSAGVNFELRVAGAVYRGNPSALTTSELKLLESCGVLLGHVLSIEQELNACDIVVLPSYREGTPTILLEAAACGLPIVATDIAGVKGLVEHGYNGYLVPTHDAHSLSRALESLITKPHLRQVMGIRSRNLAITKFSKTIINDSIFEIYREAQLVTHMD